MGAAISQDDALDLCHQPLDEVTPSGEEEDVEEEVGGEGNGWGKEGEGQGGASRVSTALESNKLTAEALKWYKHADPRQSLLFIRRLDQLAAGERSRILNKHLVGSKNFSIFETYLDQGRTALRILWTECLERNGLRGILVWYVSKH